MSRSLRESIRWAAVAAAGTALWVVSAGVPSSGQVSAPEDPRADRPADFPAVEETQRVTAVDVLVGLESDAWRSFTSGTPRLPRGLQAADFEVLHDGDVVPIIAIEAIDRGRPVATEPWTSVVVFDVVGSRTRTLRWGAGVLADRAEALVGLGSVEIALWDGAATGLRVVREPSRDGRGTRDRLSRLALQLEGDDGLVGVREDFLRRVRDAPAARPRLAVEARSAEEAKLIRHQDALLAHLEGVARRSGPRRLLFWVTGGFDADPAVFYGPDSRPATVGVDSVSETEAFVRTLAADGWIVVPVAPPRPDPLRGKGKGVRLGKWRFTGLMATYEAERDPDRAEAYLTLGDAARAQGDLEAAVDSYEKAYYHFWGDPRTKERQALALVGLASVLEPLERTSEARRALEMAAELDPSAVEGTALGASPALSRPFAVLADAAEQTGGARVRQDHQLDALIEELGLRLRLTVQLAGEPIGEVVPLAATYLGEATGRMAQWGRSGLAPRWASARARLALADGAAVDGAGEPTDPRAVLNPVEWRDDSLVAHLELALGRPLPETMRLTLAAARPGEPPVMAVGRWSTETPFDGAWTVELPTPSVAAVVWEDLDSGESGVLRVGLR